MAARIGDELELLFEEGSRFHRREILKETSTTHGGDKFWMQ